MRLNYYQDAFSHLLTTCGVVAAKMHSSYMIQVIRRIGTFPAVGAVLLRRKISDFCEISGDIFELVSKFEIKLRDLIDLE